MRLSRQTKETVGAGSFDLSDGKILRFEVSGEGLIGLEQAVVNAAGDPQQMQVRELRRERAELRGEIDEVHGRAEAADIGELVRVGEADGEGFETAHGKAGDRAAVAIVAYGVGLLNLRDDFSEQGLRKETGVVVDDVFVLPHLADGAVDKAHVAIGEGDDDDHGLDLAGGEEIVKDEIRLEGRGPGVDGVGPAVEQIEDGIDGLGAGGRSREGCRRGSGSGWRADR